MKIKLPDYDNSIIGITSSVLNYFKIECKVKTLPILDEKLTKDYKNIVVMIFDGLGSNILRTHMNDGDFLLAHKMLDISSVFPPTTTAATTSLITGLLPIEHSWLGWNLYFKEIGENVSLFPNIISGTETPAADYNVAERFIPFDDIFSKINKATNGEVQAISIYPFAGYKTQSTKEMCDIIENICKTDSKKYIHAYWNEPDFSMHKLGINHISIKEQIKLFNQQIEEMCKNLSDTLVIITADHGLIDTDHMFITDYPQIAECMVRPHSIESRAMNFFIKENKHNDFEKAFRAVFGDQFLLYSKDEIISKKIFGNAPPHPRAYEFLGDYLAIAVGTTSVEYSRPTYREVFKAQHAGLTEDEMMVPLILIECPKYLININGHFESGKCGYLS